MLAISAHHRVTAEVSESKCYNERPRSNSVVTFIIVSAIVFEDINGTRIWFLRTAGIREKIDQIHWTVRKRTLTAKELEEIVRKINEYGLTDDSVVVEPFQDSGSEYKSESDI
ncbi:unnamed protein product [Acanthoscelides obtectus]|uniref:Uncharacterized protein n=1 Tax=Acanthoscelides obtectus TaxID=200917 RepID=A0A9P0PF40_ACAOB|nr:unnamed protein product [Acanthoscelides obtectus]CAK1671009.1 hypothetical protein AOBTE_LOCUS27978 [Acanthoscelides obtectus]